MLTEKGSNKDQVSSECKIMKIDKETIWHFTCAFCKGYWTIASMDNWKPKKLYCPHCGEMNTADQIQNEK